MSDVCDVCGAPATYWQRYAGHWEDECMDRCGRHKPAANDRQEGPDVDAVLAEWRARAATSPVTTMDEFMRRQDEEFRKQTSAIVPNDWTAPTTSEEWGRMSREAFMRQRGVVVEPPTDRATQYERILQDLLAELRDRAPTYGDALTRMADHYESRLREVTSDE